MTTPDLEELSKPWLPPTPEIDNKEFSRAITQAFLTSVVAAKVLDWSGLGKKWARSGFDADDFHNQVTSKWMKIFEVGLTQVLISAALRGLEGAQAEFVTAPAVPSSVITDWASVYAHEVALQIGAQSTLAVQDLVNSGVNTRLPGAALADRAQQIYGLDPRSANAFLAYGSQKVLPRNKNLLEMAAEMLVQRGGIIGEVHSIAGINFGHQITYMAAMDQGLLEPDARKVWLTALDERVCPVCAPMDGISVPINEPFEVQLPLPKTGRGKNRKSTKMIVPPVHPNCRCTIVSEDRYLGGIITRSAKEAAVTTALERLAEDADQSVFQKAFWDENKHPRDRGGRFSRIASHLNNLSSEDTHIWGSSYTGDQAEETFAGRLRMLSMDPDFMAVLKPHIYGGLDEDAVQNAVADLQFGSGRSPEEATTRMMMVQAEMNTNLLDALRDPEVKQHLFRFMNGADEDDARAARGILESHIYNMANHPDIPLEDTREVMRGAEVWSNTIDGRNLVRKVAAADPATLSGPERDLRALLHAVEEAPANAPRLYRGMGMEDWNLSNYYKGQRLNLDLTSFSASRDVASHYTSGAINVDYLFNDKIGKHHNVFFMVDPGAKALHISPLTAGTTQAEWISRGEFVIHDIHHLNGKTIIRMAQVVSRVIKSNSYVPDDDPLLIALNSPLPRNEEVRKDWKKFDEDRKRHAEEAGVGAVGGSLGRGAYEGSAYGARTVSRYVNNHNTDAKSQRLWYERAMSNTPLKAAREKNKLVMSRNQRDKKIKQARKEMELKLGRPPTDTEFYRAGGARHLGVTGHRLEQVLAHTHGGKSGKAIAALTTVAAVGAAEAARMHREANQR